MIRALWRLSVYLLVTLAAMLVQALALLLWPAFSRRFPVYYHRLCLGIFGMRLLVVGTPASSGARLFLSNHSSYLDIPVLGALLSCHFVAKAEVAQWPLFGTLARLQNTLFIDRRMSKVGQGQTALAARLKAGEALVLFPEGTSSDGCRVLPFRRALLQTALDQAGAIELTVQPVTVYLSAMDGVPADRFDRQRYAWFGDMTLMPHLWAWCHIRKGEITVVFHPPLALADHLDRQSLAQATEAAVASGFTV